LVVVDRIGGARHSVALGMTWLTIVASTRGRHLSSR
jgi:hypothetical protein